MVFMYANALIDSGADVTICFLCNHSSNKGYVPNPIHRLICQERVHTNPRWFPLDGAVRRRCIFAIDESSFPDSDDVVATAAVTWRAVHELPRSKGKKHYLIQGYETWDLPEDELAKSYRSGMSNIVVSNWLADIVGKAAGMQPTLIKNPIDERVFYPEHDVERHDHEIAVLYNTGEHKGFSDLFEALQYVKAEVPDLVVNAFGAPKRPVWFPDWIRYTCNANQAQLREVYSRSAVYAGATINEGFGLTYVESMFCGCALAATRYKGVWEFADEGCAMLSPIRNPKALAANIVELMRNPDRSCAIAKLGREHAMAECSRQKALGALRKEFSLDV